MRGARRATRWRKAAYHEAGHATMALCLGIRVTGVEIGDNGKGSDGRCHYEFPSTHMSLRPEIMLAGETAELILTGRTRKNGTSQERVDAIMLCANAGRALPIGMVREFLLKRWWMVERIGDALFRRRSMSGEDIALLLPELVVEQD